MEHGKEREAGAYGKEKSEAGAWLDWGRGMETVEIQASREQVKIHKINYSRKEETPLK